MTAARFAGRRALVTGAAQGIGRAVATRLAADGAAVALVDLDGSLVSVAAAEIADATGSPTIAVAADVGDRAAVAAAITRCTAELGGLDITVAQAGTAGVSPFLDISDDSWDRILRTNLTGAFLTVQESARVMAPAGGGAIVVVSSTNSFYAESGHAHYTASKGGVAALVRNAALDLGPLGVRVNAISPGIIRTRLSEHLVDHPVEGPAYLHGVPLRRFGRPEDIAAVAAFLASDDAAYMTGADVIVDGGKTLGAVFDLPTTDSVAPLNPSGLPDPDDGNPAGPDRTT